MGRCEMRSGKGEEEESVCEAVTLSCVSVGVSHSSGPAQGGLVLPCAALCSSCAAGGAGTVALVIPGAGTALEAFSHKITNSGLAAGRGMSLFHLPCLQQRD